jgi:uncharacterized protein (TIGR00369 family)
MNLGMNLVAICGVLNYLTFTLTSTNQFPTNQTWIANLFTPDDMSSQIEPRDPEFEARVRQSFSEQMVMQTINAALLTVVPGQVEIGLPYQSELTQQDGFMHAGISATIMDSACGYAAFSLMPAEARVLTIEFKINLLAPAAGDSFRALGKVRKSGRSVFVAEAELYANDNGNERLVATMTGTLMAIHPQ